MLENVEGIKFEDHHGRRGIDEVLRPAASMSQRSGD